MKTGFKKKKSVVSEAAESKHPMYPKKVILTLDALIAGEGRPDKERASVALWKANNLIEFEKIERENRRK